MGTRIFYDATDKATPMREADIVAQILSTETAGATYRAAAFVDAEGLCFSVKDFVIANGLEALWNEDDKIYTFREYKKD